MKRIPEKGGDEHDAFSGWRKWLCYLKRPGVTKSIKAKYNRRFRRASKNLAKDEATRP